MTKITKHGWVFLLILVFLITSGSVCNPTDPDPDPNPNPVEHNITATAGTGGSISPSGTVKVSDGADQSFAISADTGYSISDVKVDGASVGAITTHTLTNVTADHTIEATFVALDSNLIGTWKLTFLGNQSATWDETLTFNSDGTATQIENTSGTPQTYNYDNWLTSNNIITLTATVESVTHTWDVPYSIEGNTLKVKNWTDNPDKKDRIDTWVKI